METQHDANCRKLVEAVLTSPGATDPDLRRAIEARCAEMAGCSRDEPVRVPPEFEKCVEITAKNAFRITDEEVAALRQRGYSEDAIVEITLSAALGAGIGRLEQGLAALQGSQR